MIGFGSSFELLQTFEKPLKVVSFSSEVQFKLVALIELFKFYDIKKLFHFSL